jgi:N-acetylneuraminic acid mutarotase
MAINRRAIQIKSAYSHLSSLRFARCLIRALSLLCGVIALTAAAQVPGLLNYQGRIVVHGVNFDGTGQFKFALVNTGASSVYWRNSADSNSDGEPDAAVALAVNHGSYSLSLGDTALANMAALPASIFANSEVYLRVWFNDGVTGSQRLDPDQRITAVGYAMIAANVVDGSISSEKLAPNLSSQIGALTAVSGDPQDTSLVSGGYQVFMTVPPPAWITAATANTPSARFGHTAIWSGQELIVWGGDLGQGGPASSGASYQPGSDQWHLLSPLNAPSARSRHTAVWTGTEMVIWGGAGAAGYPAAGGRFDPASLNWTAVSAVGAPVGRQGHVAVWTGSHMAIWGGLNATGLLADGALYDPVLNQWTTLSAANQPSARSAATAVWTGSRLIIWGGQGELAPLNSGGQLAFSSGVPAASWQPVAAQGAPSARFGHTAIWTGAKMIIWGGRNGGVLANDGAAYDPATDKWSALPGTGAPSAREGHIAVWTGAEMIVLGGTDSSGVVATGAAYNPATGKWRPLTNPGSPVARTSATAAWTGTEVLVFGGQDNSQPVASLQRLSPQPAWYFYRKP